MEFYIISSRETLDVFKKCKYFIHNLGMVSTVDKNGSRLLNDKDKFAFYFNNLYKSFETFINKYSFVNSKFVKDFFNIIKEDLFKENNPLTYEYLLSNQEELSKRDKGKKKYPMWYSYGRTQSIKYNEKKFI